MIIRSGTGARPPGPGRARVQLGMSQSIAREAGVDGSVGPLHAVGDRRPLGVVPDRPGGHVAVEDVLQSAIQVGARGLVGRLAGLADELVRDGRVIATRVGVDLLVGGGGVAALERLEVSVRVGPSARIVSSVSKSLGQRSCCSSESPVRSRSSTSSSMPQSRSWLATPWTKASRLAWLDRSAIGRRQALTVADADAVAAGDPAGRVEQSVGARDIPLPGARAGSWPTSRAPGASWRRSPRRRQRSAVSAAGRRTSRTHDGRAGVRVQAALRGC